MHNINEKKRMNREFKRRYKGRKVKTYDER